MFKRILIANRGEIACRIIRTARRMGISIVAEGFVRARPEAKSSLGTVKAIHARPGTTPAVDAVVMEFAQGSVQQGQGT